MMALKSGTQLGHYEIQCSLGAGGMGEVYRARDSKLKRDVALKVLPEAVASNALCMARFKREAELLAALNHSNIAAIYGLEESSGTQALAMELVEGPTLGDRISQGAIPLDEALPIAKQIAEAFEYAHEHGVIHRDLKPSNVKIRPDGTVKVLDFGLAKALEDDPVASGIANSPTMSHMATMAGIILGTAAYMSPEQAKGKAADRRVDIWSFGCVLYEMLTGKMAFSGETAAEILAAVIRAEPDWSQLDSVPPRMEDLIARCLRKDPRQRLQAFGDARIGIEEYLANPIGDSVQANLSGPSRDGGARLALLPWALLGLAATALAVVSIGYIRRVPEPEPAIVSQISAPPNTSFLAGNRGGIPVLSPDGQRLAFVAAGSDHKQLLWVRRLNAVAAQPLAGTEDAAFPFWSPDGRNLGFFLRGKLSRIDVSGGPPLALCDAPSGRGGAWGRDGTILFTPTTASPILRVPDSGGTPQPATSFHGSRSHRWPQFFPDQKHFLFFARDLPESLPNATARNGVYAGSLEGGEPKLLVRTDSGAVYVSGYLLFVRDRTLMAQRFDADKLTVMGDAVPLVENIQVNAIVQRGMFNASGNGILAYEPGSAAPGGSELLWFDRSGKRLEETGTPGEYSTPRISPDGRKLVVGISPSLGMTNLWIFEPSRAMKTRLTFSSALDTRPEWSPDGKIIAFASNRDGVSHLYQQAADGTGQTTPLLVDNTSEGFVNWSRDGRYLVFERLGQQTGPRTEIWALPLFGDRKSFPVVQSQFDASAPALSPRRKMAGLCFERIGTE
jgi:eukaryotic-like serine/threonine-protein kinase